MLFCHKNWPHLENHFSLGAQGPISRGSRPPSQGALWWPMFMCILHSYVESHIRYVLGYIRRKKLIKDLCFGQYSWSAFGRPISGDVGTPISPNLIVAGEPFFNVQLFYLFLQFYFLSFGFQFFLLNNVRSIPCLRQISLWIIGSDNDWSIINILYTM